MLGLLFKELSSILTAHDLSYPIKGEIYRTCVQSVLILWDRNLGNES